MVFGSKNYCVGCDMGAHPHDTWGANAPEVKRGEHQVGDDAGCPRIGCQCTYVAPPRRPDPHCPTCRCNRKDK